MSEIKRFRPTPPPNNLIGTRLRAVWPEVDEKIEAAQENERQRKAYLKRLDHRLRHHMSTLSPAQLRQFLEDDRPQIAQFHKAIYGELLRRRTAKSGLKAA